MMNSFNLTVSGKHSVCPSILNESFAGYSNLGFRSLRLILGNVIMMCLGVFLLLLPSLGPASLGLSELPGLPGSLFPLSDWGSFPSLFVQISFQFLAVVLLLLAPYNSDTGTFQVVPEVPKPLLIFSEVLFLHSVQVECFFLPSGPNH